LFGRGYSQGAFMASANANHFAGPATVFAEIRAAEQAADLERNALAAKTVANYAHDAADCGHLLAVLGLDLSELK
ncbi:hypothetical protein, partial [Streptomyces sp. NPDC101166]|uniref:hypothetical protein n=1 Tax=Streptomyces sp. NPDC101166 TaxID=3366120 RepID=UPI003810C5C9